MAGIEAIQSASVIGAGVMGTGLAITIASKGIPVCVNDISDELLSGSRKLAHEILEDLNDSGMMDSIDAVESNMRFVSSLEAAVRDADIVFESITEDPIAKHELFEELQDRTKESAILASNTSVIKIAEIAAGLRSRERVVGIHWMNPPYVAPLVELTGSQWSNPDLIASLRVFLQDRIGKKVVLSPDIPGFIVNRFHAVVASEAIRLIDEGVSIEDVDNVWKYHLGLLYSAFGPLGNADYIGLDTTYLAGMYLTTKLERNIVYIPEWFTKKLGNNELGVKSGKGFYDYGKESPAGLYAKRIKILREELKCLKVQK